MAFSFDEFFDPLLRHAADDFESSVPYVLRGAYRELTRRLVEASVDDTVKALVERLIASWLETDQSQPFKGYALASLAKEDAQSFERVGLDPISILVWVEFALQVVEWFRKRREGQPMALTAEGPRVVDGMVIEALTLKVQDNPAPVVEETAEGPATTADVSGTDAPADNAG